MVMGKANPLSRISTAKKPYYLITSLVKGLQVLELLAQGTPLTVTEVARALGQDRSASNRFLLTLRDRDYVQEVGDGTYTLSTKLFALAQGAIPQNDIRAVARPYMSALARRYGQTVNLGRLEGNEIVTIEVAPGTDVIRFDGQVGARDLAHTLAMGKAVLAFRSLKEQQQYLQDTTLVAKTPRTFTDPERLRDHLAVVKKRGYAIDDEEWADGVRCAAAPVFAKSGRMPHAISVSGPVQSMERQRLHRIAKALCEVCRAISIKLGGSSEE